LTPRCRCGHRNKRLAPATAPSFSIESKARPPNPPRVITPYYRVSRPGSSETGAQAATGPSPQRTSNQGKKPAKEDGSPIFLGIKAFVEGGETRRLRTAIWNRDSRRVESAHRCHRINFTRFRRAARATARKNSLRRSGLASRGPIAEPSACHRDRRARKHAPKRAIRDIGRS
jgi:hypothetical protein